MSFISSAVIGFGFSSSFTSNSFFFYLLLVFILFFFFLIFFIYDQVDFLVFDGWEFGFFLPLVVVLSVAARRDESRRDLELVSSRLEIFVANCFHHFHCCAHILNFSVQEFLKSNNGCEGNFEKDNSDYLEIENELIDNVAV